MTPPSIAAWSGIGGFLVQPKMSSVFVIVVHVVGEESFQVAFVQSDDGVEQVASATADPALDVQIVGGVGVSGAASADQDESSHNSRTSETGYNGAEIASWKSRSHILRYRAPGRKAESTTRYSSCLCAGTRSRPTCSCTAVRNDCGSAGSHFN